MLDILKTLYLHLAITTSKGERRMLDVVQTSVPVQPLCSETGMPTGSQVSGFNSADL